MYFKRGTSSSFVAGTIYPALKNQSTINHKRKLEINFPMTGYGIE